MKVTVIDGQGGGLGRQLISALKKEDLNIVITAIGTNSTATTAMLKAGADKAATGENAVIVGCRNTDVIVGPLGIAIADALLGEITPKMAKAVGQSTAVKILIPMNLCDNIIPGIPQKPAGYFIESTIETIRTLCMKQTNVQEVRY